MSIFEPWPELLSDRCRSLIDTASTMTDFDVQTISKLRKLGSPDQVRLAIDLVTARRKADCKFPNADRLAVLPEPVEQATSQTVADYKSKRFGELDPDHILDLCCGIGGDAMSLAKVAPLTLIDLDPIRVWMARHNTNKPMCNAVVADVTKLNLKDCVYHIDPSRRAGGRRIMRYEDYLPGPAFLEELVRVSRAGAIKLGPGVDRDDLPPGEVEFINERGTLVQAVLWTGELARHQITATKLPDNVSYSGSVHQPPVVSPDRFLLAVDPAIERARLIGSLCHDLNIGMIHRDLGLLTSDHPVVNPWLTPFELIAVMPWRMQKVKTWLREHDAGIVEVKTRGKAVNPDKVQKQLRSKGDTTYTVFVLRHDQQIRAWITKRCSVT